MVPSGIPTGNEHLENLLRALRESTSDSVRARRAPVPTIESQTKPPSKFKGEMSFIKVDVFPKKFERYLRTGYGLDLESEDISDYVLNSLDEYAYRWFDTLSKPYPYLFSKFDHDLRQRYVPREMVRFAGRNSENRNRENVFNGGATTSGRIDERRPQLDSARRICPECMSHESSDSSC